MGIGSGILMGVFAEYYTSAKYNPTRRLAKLSEQGMLGKARHLVKASSHTYTHHKRRTGIGTLSLS